MGLIFAGVVWVGEGGHRVPHEAGVRQNRHPLPALTHPLKTMGCAARTLMATVSCQQS
jgi:hypothetical protein